MPSSRAAATWQTVEAIVPSARSRYACPASASAASATQRGSADSMPSSSSRPSASRRSPAARDSSARSSHAPLPRRAIHSSSGPKS